jgi:Holliday junction DNA helicase RuvA
MIALLTGNVVHLDAGSCVIDVNGVGYLVQASARTLAALPKAPSPARVLVETVVREDAILLYGFTEAAERDWFRLLTTVQGVGAKVALAILSAMSPHELVAAIAAGDRASLNRAPGVGPKLAVRLLTELRDKAGAMPTGLSLPELPAAAARGVAADVLSALANLGYRRAEAQPAVERALAATGAASGAAEGDATLDVVLRASLRELGR